MPSHKPLAKDYGRRVSHGACGLVQRGFKWFLRDCGGKDGSSQTTPRGLWLLSAFLNHSSGQFAHVAKAVPDHPQSGLLSSAAYDRHCVLPTAGFDQRDRQLLSGSDVHLDGLKRPALVGSCLQKIAHAKGNKTTSARRNPLFCSPSLLAEEWVGRVNRESRSQPCAVCLKLGRSTLAPSRNSSR